MQPEDLHVARRLRRADLRHLVAINDLRVALVLATRAAAGVELDLFLADHDLRRAAGKAVPAYVPDALVRLTTPSGVFGYAVEVDAGTESHRYVVARKIRAVDRLWRSGRPCWGLAPWRPLFITISERRLRLLGATFMRERAGDLWLASVLGVVQARGALSNTLLTMEEVARAQSGEALGFRHALLAPPGPIHPCPSGPPDPQGQAELHRTSGNSDLPRASKNPGFVRKAHEP